MAGMHSNNRGGGSEYLCMTEDPDAGVYPYHPHTWIWGAEYIGGNAVFGKDIKNHDAVCSVCQSPRTAQVIPDPTLILPEKL